MSDPIERLKASKEELELRKKVSGKKDGREWAEEYAEYEDLTRIEKLDGDEYNGRARDWDNLVHALDTTDSEAAERLFGDDADVEDLGEEYIEAFIEGVQEFFSEVKDKL